MSLLANAVHRSLVSCCPVVRRTRLVTMALVSTEAQLRSMSPGPERFMTMNLMSSGPCTVSKGATSYGRTVRRMNTRDNHTTADVDGARTFVRTSTLTNKPDSYGVAVRHTNKPNMQRSKRGLFLREGAMFFLRRTVRCCVAPIWSEVVKGSRRCALTQQLGYTWMIQTTECPCVFEFFSHPR